MVEKVRETVYNKCLWKYEQDILLNGVIVGFSGGIDSTALLHIFSGIAREAGFPIYAVHINHGIRGADADEDEMYCREFAKHLGVSFWSYKRNVLEEAKEKKIGIEECGRSIRYEIFNQVMSERDVKLLALAHNKNDLAETVLMNIARGCGLNGLLGMDYRRDRVIRPLLGCTREEIERYCTDNGLNPRVDQSNYEDFYTRNRVRSRLFPVMNEVFGHDLIKKFADLSDHVKIDMNYINSKAEEAFEKLVFFENSQNASVDGEKIVALHEAVATRVLLKVIFQIKGDLNRILKTHVQDIMGLAKKKITGKRINLPDDIVTWYKYGKIIIRYRDTEEKYENDPDRMLNIQGETVWGKHTFTVSRGVENTDDMYETSEVFNGTMIEGAVIRNRRPGDSIYLYKRNCRKKLKEFFIDEKVPLEKRDSIPLIAKGNEVIWIVGYAKNGKYHESSHAHDAVMIKMNKRTENVHNDKR